MDRNETKEETLDEKIARIRRQNEAIERRKKMIDEEIRDAKKNGAVLDLKNQAVETEEDKKFGATLYSDQLSTEKKTVKEEDNWNVKLRPRKSVTQPNKSDEAWREERKRIDEERIRRQKANSGSWKREWDADKTTSSDNRDNRTLKDAGNRFDRSSSTIERSENRTYNFNESKGSFNHYGANEGDDSQNRWKADNSFQKTYSERRNTDNYESDNRKPNIIRSNVRKTSTSEIDKYNNNATKLYSRNNLKSNVQNTSFTTKNDQFDLDPIKNDQFEEENWDVKFAHDNIATKLHSKSNSRSGIHVAPFTTTCNISKEETRNSKSTGVTLVKSNESLSGEDVRSQFRSEKRNSSSMACSKIKPTRGFKNRLAQPNKSPNANTSLSTSPQNNHRYIEVDDSETTVIIPKDLKNIVVQVGNRGMATNKREVKLFGDSKSDPSIPKFTIGNLNTSQEVDAKTLSGYGSMTFERSDLKRRAASKFSKNLPSPTSIATQMFSNSKIGDNNYVLKDEIVDNCEQKSFTSFQAPNVFQFSAAPCTPDFGDIVHNTTTPQNVKIIRTIKNENITLIKEPPKTNSYDNSKRTTRLEIKTNQSKKVDKAKCNEVVKKNQVEKIEVFVDNDDSDEEWDDCSDEESEEECGFA